MRSARHIRAIRWSLIGTVLFCSSLGLAAPRAKTAVKPTISGLTELGYHRHVAKQLIKSYPDLAQKIVDLAGKRGRVKRGKDEAGFRYYQAGKAAYEPVTLYRGVDRPTFDPRFETHQGFQVFMTDSLSTALGYAFNDVEDSRLRGISHGLVFELQIPRFLLRYASHSGNYPVLRTELVADHQPLIARLGLARYTQAAERAQERDNVAYLEDPKRVRWQPINKIGKFIETVEEE